MMARMALRGQKIVVRLHMAAQTFPDADSFNTVAELVGSEHPEQVGAARGRRLWVNSLSPWLGGSEQH